MACLPENGRSTEERALLDTTCAPLDPNSEMLALRAV